MNTLKICFAILLTILLVGCATHSPHGPTIVGAKGEVDAGPLGLEAGVNLHLNTGWAGDGYYDDRGAYYGADGRSKLRAAPCEFSLGVMKSTAVTEFIELGSNKGAGLESWNTRAGVSEDPHSAGWYCEGNAGGAHAKAGGQNVRPEDIPEVVGDMNMSGRHRGYSPQHDPRIYNYNRRSHSGWNTCRWGVRCVRRNWNYNQNYGRRYHYEHW